MILHQKNKILKIVVFSMLFSFSQKIYSFNFNDIGIEMSSGIGYSFFDRIGYKIESPYSMEIYLEEDQHLDIYFDVFIWLWDKFYFGGACNIPTKILEFKPGSFKPLYLDSYYDTGIYLPLSKKLTVETGFRWRCKHPIVVYGIDSKSESADIVNGNIFLKLTLKINRD